MPKTEFKVRGLQALQQKLMEAKEKLEIALTVRLKYLGKDAVTYSKKHKGYHDRTANLKNSISYVLYHDGKPIDSAIGQGVEGTDAKSLAQINSEIKGSVESFAKENAQPKGYTLVIVAGMNYAKHVENKGYNVLHLTRYFLEDELKTLIQEVLEDVKNGKV